MIIADSGYINHTDYPVTVQCIVREAQRQKLEPELLWAILRQENGRVGQRVMNTNRTYDIGPMQINNGKNQKYLIDLQKKSGLSYSKFNHLLHHDACFNVSVGAYVLRTKINAAGNTFKGAGWYNSANEPHFSRYLKKVKAHYRNIKGSKLNQSQIKQAKQNLHVKEQLYTPPKANQSKLAAGMVHTVIPSSVQASLNGSKGKTSGKISNAKMLSAVNTVSTRTSIKKTSVNKTVNRIGIKKSDVHWLKFPQGQTNGKMKQL